MHHYRHFRQWLDVIRYADTRHVAADSGAMLACRPRHPYTMMSRLLPDIGGYMTAGACGGLSIWLGMEELENWVRDMVQLEDFGIFTDTS